MSEAVLQNEVLFNKVANRISEVGNIAVEKISPESTFNSLGFDSLDALAFLSDLEEEYNVKIPNQELLKIRNVAQVVDSLQKRIA